jgi:hypothetical protein
VDTKLADVISVIITFGSKHCVALLRTGDRLFFVRSYSLATFKEEWEHRMEGKFIKADIIEQAEDGQTLGIAYNDKGRYKCLFKDTETGNTIDEIDVTEKLGLDRKSVAMEDIYVPMNTMVFRPDGTVSISIFHRYMRKHFQFLYDIRSKEMLTEVYTCDIPSISDRCFNVKSFYSHYTKQIYTFYRNGYCVTYSENKQRLEQITTEDLGAMFLIYERALLVRSSRGILFFKVVKGKWVQYNHFPDVQG